MLNFKTYLTTISSTVTHIGDLLPRPQQLRPRPPRLGDPAPLTWSSPITRVSVDWDTTTTNLIRSPGEVASSGQMKTVRGPALLLKAASLGWPRSSWDNPRARRTSCVRPPSWPPGSWCPRPTASMTDTETVIGLSGWGTTLWQHGIPVNRHFRWGDTVSDLGKWRHTNQYWSYHSAVAFPYLNNWYFWFRNVGRKWCCRKQLCWLFSVAETIFSFSPVAGEPDCEAREVHASEQSGRGWPQWHCIALH